MHAWESIQTVVDYIEENLADTMEIEQLAQMAGLSEFYFQRLFSRLVKKPVREYIKLRRLANASEALKQSDARILDIALAYGFNSHEAFTKAFKEAYGMTPEQFRANPTYLNQFYKPELLLQYVQTTMGVPLIVDDFVIEMNVKTLEKPIWFMGVQDYVPIAGQMPLGEATGPDIPGLVWETFHKKKHAIPKVENPREIGVAFWGDAVEGMFTYFVGTEVSKNAERFGEFSLYELPARKYVVCGFEAENFETLVTVAINKAVKYSVVWAEENGYAIDGYSPEIYYAGTPETAYMELWLPV